METAGTAHPPSVEPGYRAGRLLGSGRAARVWLALRESDGSHFALKTLLPAAGGPSGTFETRRELNILTRFEHENLLQLHTVLETDQGPGLLMEYAPGESLARLLAVRGTLAPGEAVTVLVGIGSALEYLHGQGIAHGKVSPGNILFTAQGKPLLADLGTARLLGTAESTNDAPAPTAAHDEGMSPGAGSASAHHPGPPGPEADLHALAAVGWLLLTGRGLPPQEHRPRLAVLVPGIPPALAGAVEAGLDDAARRPDAAGFVRLVFDSAPAEPLELDLPVPGQAGPGLETRRSRIERGRAARSLLAPGRRGKSRVDGGRNRVAQQGGLHRTPLLIAAAVLVAGTTGLGAVAVAAPELLRPPGSGAPAANDASERPANAAPPAAPGQEDHPAALGQEEQPGAPADPQAAANTSAQTVPQTGQPNGAANTGQLPDAAAKPAPGPGPLTGVPEHELQSLLRGNDLAAAAGALAELRARAFGTANSALLDGVNIPGSPAMIADRAEIAKLEAAGTVLSGLAVEVLSAGPVLPGEDGRATVPAAVSTSAYAERDAGGGLLRRTEELSRQDIVLALIRTPAGWRIEDILAAPS